MKTTYELNAPQHATHYRLVSGVAIYYHIDNAIFKYDAHENWVEYVSDEKLKGLIEI